MRPKLTPQMQALMDALKADWDDGDIVPGGMEGAARIAIDVIERLIEAGVLVPGPKSEVLRAAADRAWQEGYEAASEEIGPR